MSATLWVMSRPTSFRLSEELLERLESEASAAGTTVTALVSELLTEGLDQLGYAGLVFRGGPSGRRAAIAGGPDVWEVVRDLRDMEGQEDERIRALCAVNGLDPRQISIAIDYYLDHREVIDERIAADEAAAARVRLQLERRAQLFAS